MNNTIVPLELINLEDDGFHLLVEVVVFGEKFRAVLDTGASRTVLDKSMIENYTESENLLISDRLSTGLGTNSMESHTINVPSFGIGTLSIPNFTVAVLDLSTINTAYEALNLPAVIGVVGGDILHYHGAVVSYQNLSLKLSLKSSQISN